MGIVSVFSDLINYLQTRPQNEGNAFVVTYQHLFINLKLIVKPQVLTTNVKT